LTPGLINLSDSHLLEALCTSDDDHLLYNEFVIRFLPAVQGECEKVCKSRKLDGHVGIQIAHETFERIRKYKSFKKDQIKLPDERKGILIYLNRVSLSLFNDFHKRCQSKEIDHKTYFDDIISAETSGTGVNELKRKKDLAVLMLKKLNAKEQKVILTDLEYKRHQKYLPDDVIEVLATELNVKSDSIRKIRERAIQKIKKAIDEFNQG
jgi:DNA-directed RNA polymerase specialized sigma24 family protein